MTNVKGVTNEVQVGGISTYSARANDTYLTSKVKARFIEPTSSRPTTSRW